MAYWKKRSKKPPVAKPKIGKRVVKSDFEFDLYNSVKDKHPDTEYETEKFHYILEYDYIPDLIIPLKKGKLYIEAKGNGRAFDAGVQKKMIAVKKQHPDKDIRIVFYRDGPVGNKRKDGSFKKQSEWAEDHGFPWAIKNIPEDWLIDE